MVNEDDSSIEDILNSIKKFVLIEESSGSYKPEEDGVVKLSPLVDDFVKGEKIGPIDMPDFIRNASRQDEHGTNERDVGRQRSRDAEDRMTGFEANAGPNPRFGAGTSADTRFGGNTGPDPRFGAGGSPNTRLSGNTGPTPKLEAAAAEHDGQTASNIIAPLGLNNQSQPDNASQHIHKNDIVADSKQDAQTILKSFANAVKELSKTKDTLPKTGTLDQLVIDTIKTTVEHWVESNIKDIVETLVKEEIKTITNSILSNTLKDE
ncbi:MAG: DUF2497 domain-containing protein [Holosporales bacterium]|jgi:hypothetical protein|nr:DUF2497 domain-containing protein [Holosporales bacterium]